MTTTTTANLRTGIRMSLDDFLALGETDGRWELDDGVLYIMSSGTPDHQFLMGRFMWNFQNYLEQFDTPPAQFFHEMTTILSRELQRAPEPDLVIILNESREIVGPVRVEGAPDIIIEILSTDRRRDLGYKRRIYAEAGVQEYWPTDPRNDTLTRLQLQNGEYIEQATLGPADTLTTPLLPGLSIPLTDIFRHRHRPTRRE